MKENNIVSFENRKVIQQNITRREIRPYICLDQKCPQKHVRVANYIVGNNQDKIHMDFFTDSKKREEILKNLPYWKIARNRFGLKHNKWFIVPPYVLWISEIYFLTVNSRTEANNFIKFSQNKICDVISSAPAFTQKNRNQDLFLYPWLDWKNYDDKQLYKILKLSGKEINYIKKYVWI
ncbi:Uncharacterised protein (plasmid) [Mesomycoplasma conjunctivae]|nr:hypothetical protein [Mesomycoplasma conjunctivae]VEU66212.1 Uncharacterised protein [Mesomycoplasma conjunctivae]VEU66417.1 Uncharacterised protein [Mesomycoplasma conjunctivae]VEU66646.1 Uncharacterised protein [Mesomycoplasma conjunctivae]